jgi:hypothetical protein
MTRILQEEILDDGADNMRFQRAQEFVLTHLGEHLHEEKETEKSKVLNKMDKHNFCIAVLLRA